MSFVCRICENSANNRVYRAREMMFGMRDEFDYFQCGSCGTLQIAEIPDLDRYYPADYYSLSPDAVPIDFPQSPKRRLAARLAAHYFLHPNNFVGQYIAARKTWISDLFPAALRAYPTGLGFRSRILDFGCGAGRLLRILHHFGFRDLTGADAFIEGDIFYPSGVKIYKRGLAELDPAYDLVMLHHSFEHLPDPLESLREIRRLVAPGGLALIRMPVVSFAWEEYGADWVQLDPPRHLYLYTEKGFRRMAGRAGFAVEKVIYDSEAFQFWGSEQYLRDISQADPRAYRGFLSESIFTAGQMAEWERRAEELNAGGRGDQACYYLRKN